MHRNASSGIGLGIRRAGAFAVFSGAVSPGGTAQRHWKVISFFPVVGKKGIEQCAFLSSVRNKLFSSESFASVLGTLCLSQVSDGSVGGLARASCDKEVTDCGPYGDIPSVDVPFQRGACLPINMHRWSNPAASSSGGDWRSGRYA